MEYNIKFTFPHLQKILDSLAKEPYKEVFQIVNHLQTSFASELERINKEKEEEQKVKDGNSE
jgi:hypothetical protein